MVAEDVHRSEIKGVHGAGRGGALGKAWWCGCRVRIADIGVRDRLYGQVSDRDWGAIANSGIRDVRLMHGSMEGQVARKDGPASGGSCSSGTT